LQYKKKVQRRKGTSPYGHIVRVEMVKSASMCGRDIPHDSYELGQRGGMNREKAWVY
jgi:hypothetical protein